MSEPTHDIIDDVLSRESGHETTQMSARRGREKGVWGVEGMSHRSTSVTRVRLCHPGNRALTWGHVF